MGGPETVSTVSYRQAGERFVLVRMGRINRKARRTGSRLPRHAGLSNHTKRFVVSTDPTA